MFFLITRKNALMKMNIPEKIFDWFCFIKNLIPFYPRKKLKKKNKSYFSEKSINEVIRDPFLTKLKTVFKWKKSQEKNKEKNFHHNYRFPCIYFENFFKKRNLKFLNFLKKLEEIFLYNFFLINQFSYENLLLGKNKNITFYILSFIVNLKLLAQFKNILNTNQSFQIEFNCLGRNFFLIFPKKKIFVSNIFKKKKTALPFEEINLSLLILISNKLEKINRLGILKKINNLPNFDAFSKISFRIKFYVQNKKSNSQKKIKKFHLIQYKKLQDLVFNKKSSKYLKNSVWIFSKNLDFPSLFNQKPIEAIFFRENFMNDNAFIFFFFLLEINFSFLNNEKKTIFYLLKKIYQRRSFISIYLQFDWVFDSLNSKIFLPCKFYSLKNIFKKKLNPLFYKLKGEKNFFSNEIFRKKLKKRKKIIVEKFCRTNFLFFFAKLNEKKTIKCFKIDKNHAIINCIKFDSIY
jgi:hypothetical protein